MVGWLQQDLILLGAQNLLSKLQTKHTHNTNTCKYFLCQSFVAMLTHRTQLTHSKCPELQNVYLNLLSRSCWSASSNTSLHNKAPNINTQNSVCSLRATVNIVYSLSTCGTSQHQNFQGYILLVMSHQCGSTPLKEHTEPFTTYNVARLTPEK